MLKVQAFGIRHKDKNAWTSDQNLSAWSVLLLKIPNWATVTFSNFRSFSPRSSRVLPISSSLLLTGFLHFYFDKQRLHFLWKIYFFIFIFKSSSSLAWSSLYASHWQTTSQSTLSHSMAKKPFLAKCSITFQTFQFGVKSSLTVLSISTKIYSRQSCSTLI